MLLKPNIDCKLAHKTGYNKHSEPTYGPDRSVKCRVVRFKSASLKSTVRADSSATRGRAQEEIFETIILFHPSTNIAKDDKVTIFGQVMRVVSIEIRLTTSGKVDHYEVGLNVWE
jgi:hypothetical protein